MVRVMDVLAPLSAADTYASLGEYRAAYGFEPGGAGATGFELAHFLYQQARPGGQMRFTEQRDIAWQVEQAAFPPRDLAWAESKAQPFSPLEPVGEKPSEHWTRAPDTLTAKRIEAFLGAVTEASRNLDPSLWELATRSPRKTLPLSLDTRASRCLCRTKRRIQRALVRRREVLIVYCK